MMDHFTESSNGNGQTYSKFVCIKQFSGEAWIACYEWVFLYTRNQTVCNILLHQKPPSTLFDLIPCLHVYSFLASFAPTQFLDSNSKIKLVPLVPLFESSDLLPHLNVVNHIL